MTGTGRARKNRRSAGKLLAGALSAGREGKEEDQGEAAGGVRTLRWCRDGRGDVLWEEWEGSRTGYGAREQNRPKLDRVPCLEAAVARG